MIATLSPEKAAAAEVVAEFFRQSNHAGSKGLELLQARNQTVIEWAEKNFYIPTDSGRQTLIRFLPHQKVILELFFNPKYALALGCETNFQTLVYSTVKKSGKTAVAALVSRWITETWGSHAEVYALANDLEQARGRIYAAALASIELDPRYRRADKGIAGLWRIIEREAAYIPTHSSLKAVSSDYKGEAGSNPTATLWSELWGYESEAAQRLWEELTPVPTRPRSIRYVETYAGYEGQSGILNDLEDRLKDDESGSRRLTLDELRSIGLDWPWPDQPLPFYLHTATRTFAYWDEDEIARRMPWQTPAYYAAQEGELRPSAYKRLHLNKRASQEEEFIPIQWWDRLERPIPVLDENTPVVVAADGSVTGDCTAYAVVSRDPEDDNNVLVRDFMSWSPQEGQPLNYSLTLEPALRRICTGHIHPLDQDCKTHSLVAQLGECVPSKPYNVAELAFDIYQLHDMTTRFNQEGVAWCRQFSQQGDRMIADKSLYDKIRDQRIHHTGDRVLRTHVQNAAAQVPPKDNTKLRLIKKAAKSKIDGIVCVSMAVHEALRLNL